MRIHVSLNVSSLDRSKDFYRRLFGRAASKERADYANFRLDDPPIHLALREGEPVSHCCGGLSHLGVELPDHAALGAWRERLEAAGVPIAREDDAACCYARADKLWLQDPDGYRWEVWVRTGEHDSMGGAGVAAAPVGAESAACC